MRAGTSGFEIGQVQPVAVNVAAGDVAAHRDRVLEGGSTHQSDKPIEKESECNREINPQHKSALGELALH